MKTDERISLGLALVVLMIFVGTAWWAVIAQLGVGNRPGDYWRGMAVYMVLAVGLPGIATGWLLWKLDRRDTRETWLWIVPVLLIVVYWGYWFIHATIPLWAAIKQPELWEAGRWKW